MLLIYRLYLIPDRIAPFLITQDMVCNNRLFYFGCGFSIFLKSDFQASAGAYLVLFSTFALRYLQPFVPHFSEGATLVGFLKVILLWKFTVVMSINAFGFMSYLLLNALSLFIVASYARVSQILQYFGNVGQLWMHLPRSWKWLTSLDCERMSLSDSLGAIYQIYLWLGAQPWNPVLGLPEHWGSCSPSKIFWIFWLQYWKTTASPFLRFWLLLLCYDPVQTL